MRQIQFADNTGGNSMAVQQRTVLLKGQTFVGMTDRMAEVQCLTDAVLLRVFLHDTFLYGYGLGDHPVQKVCGFPMEKLSQVVYYLKEYYPAFVFDCKDYDTLYELMTHDKKNEAGIINFTLLSQVGDVQINQQVSKEKILESLDFYRESFGV